MNTLHTSKGEMSLSIFDIYSFLKLPLSRHRYDEVVPTQRERTNKLLRSCTYLFTAYHKFIQGPKGKSGLFKMVTFMDKTTNGRHYLRIQPSENDVDGEETKLPICNSITSLCKSNCITGILKTGKILLLSSHIKVKGNLRSYRLLRHDIESGHKSQATLPLHEEFAYKLLYWEWLEDILFVAKLNSQHFICLMLCILHSSFMISAQTSSD
ncbi:hypothetical protein Cgig2_021414 [Carnegiea gigantea]|uniref:Uncharacterized protein n=1 Tax=Carnegiea gigantea TaxID=171969 RepID=A0A9Q1GXA9_9CARY|nr:hypothetical protein Cgig2_021414 [Carnegiea gigantea]